MLNDNNLFSINVSCDSLAVRAGDYGRLRQSFLGHWFDSGSWDKFVIISMARWRATSDVECAFYICMGSIHILGS